MDDDYDDQLIGAGCDEPAAERAKRRRTWQRRRVRVRVPPRR